MPDKSIRKGPFKESGIRTVLFVDDEATVLNATKELFSDDAVIRLLVASSGEEALDIIRREDVWIVVSDHHMPGITGIELLERIKHISPTTGRILMTAHADLKTAIDAINISEAFRLSEERIKHVRYGGWLHDCGKIGVPEAVLNFPGHLDESGMKIIHRHPLWGAEVARQAGLPTEVVNTILYHHEKYDGTGYPHGLKGEEITLEARIVTIADVFDSLRTRRSYRVACTSDQTRKIMLEMTESFFDPQLMGLFQEIAEEVLNEDALRAAAHHRDLIR